MQARVVLGFLLSTVSYFDEAFLKAALAILRTATKLFNNTFGLAVTGVLPAEVRAVNVHLAVYRDYLNPKRRKIGFMLPIHRWWLGKPTSHSVSRLWGFASNLVHRC